MSSLLSRYLSNLTLGSPQQHKNMLVFPVFTASDAGPEYLTLKEALSANLVTVAEISQGGHVPQLKVINRAATPVLLVDGEEMLGARQNRVLNTSILVKKTSETTIPVSCTEAGRWAYSSPHLTHSGHLMSYNLRKLKSSSVLTKLKQSQGYSSDQHALWAGVHALETKAGTRSPTHALADTFQAKLAELDCFLQAFPPLPEQKGLVVLINAEIAGFDLLSLPRAYQSLHSQFIKSYAMDALLEEKPANNFELARERVSLFLEESKATAEKVFAAISLGSDYRFESPTITGSALVTEETIIHLNLYRN